MLVDAHIALGRKDQALAAGERLLRVRERRRPRYLVFGVVNESSTDRLKRSRRISARFDKEPGHLAISPGARQPLLARQQRVPERDPSPARTPRTKNARHPSPHRPRPARGRAGNIPAAVAAYRHAPWSARPRMPSC